MIKIMYRLVFILILFSPLVGFSQTVDSNFVDGVVYVKVKDTSTIELSPYQFSNPDLNALYLTFGIDTIKKPFPGLNTTLDKTYRIYFQQIQLIDALITELSLIPFIEYAEKAPLYKVSYLPNDIHPSQWALSKINAIQAWDISKGSAQITIAIVDNAVSTTHEDLKENIWVNPNEIPNNGIDDDLNGFVDDVNGWDVADNNNNPNPPDSFSSNSYFTHGTHCAGIASATTDNNKGVAAIGFNTKIIAVKCSRDNSADEGRTLSHAYDGVYYAIQAKADIISMSWGGSSGSFLTGENIINAANALGIVLISAAGNNNHSEKHYPAAYNPVISVGSTDQADLKSSFSNYGDWVDLMAPGSSIYSTLSGANNAYGTRSGTSMSCPMVAGLSALVLEQNPGLSPTQVKNILMNGCDNIDLLNPGHSGKLGAGRINAQKTLQHFTGLTHFDEKSSFDLYPNPNHGAFTVRTNITESVEINLFDLRGIKVYTEFRNFETSNDFNIDLNSGIYFLEIATKEKKFVKKIVIP
jgi:subtilisin family serine protease